MIFDSIVNFHGSYDDICNFFASYALLLIVIAAVKYLGDVKGVTVWSSFRLDDIIKGQV